MAQTYMVAAWRGTNNGYRILGRGLSEDQAIRRITLAMRIWPESAKPKAYAEQLGDTDSLELIRKPQ